MPITADQDLDLVTTTLKNLSEKKWTDIVSSRQRHIFINQILKKDKVGFGSGTGIQFNVQVNPAGSFRMVGMGAQIPRMLLQVETAISPPKLFTSSCVPGRTANAVSVWTETENAASIGIHQSVGFRVVGTRERIGQMNGLWRDVVLMERRSSVV
jgi:hypothetical protein